MAPQLSAPSVQTGTVSDAAPPARLPSARADKVSTSTADSGSIAHNARESVERVAITEMGDNALAPSDEDGPPLDVILADEASPTVIAQSPRVSTDQDDTDATAKAAPALDDLVARIPADVRETLEDLFRARFVKVTRVPKSAVAPRNGTAKPSLSSP